MNKHKCKKNCLICRRINLIKNKKNPYFVKELKTGYVVLGDFQFFKGYTLFLCKKHETELHQLKPKFRRRFLWEMSLVAEAVYKAFRPEKINYALLGNTDCHIHWHLFPRYKNDPLPNRTVWNIDKKIREAESAKPDKKLLFNLKKELQQELKNLHIDSTI